MSQREDIKNLMIEDARIIFRNFSGKGDKFNQEGNRNFNVILDEPTALELQRIGWNVRTRPPREEGEPPRYMLNVKLGYNYPPKVVLISNKKKTELDESTVNILDYSEFDKIDLVIRPYSYDVNGNKGIKAYLKVGYFTLVVDEFAEKYDDDFINVDADEIVDDIEE